MPFIEIATFPASESLLADVSSAQETLSIIAKAEGFIGAYGGIQLEDQKTAYFVAVWNSPDDPKKFRENAENQTKFVESFKQNATGPPELEFVEFSGDTTPLTAPLTSIEGMTLKEGKTADDLNAVIGSLAGVLQGTEGLHFPVIYGGVLEKPTKFYNLVGWDSLEAHGAAAGAEKAQAVVGQFVQTVDISVVHVKFKKFTFA